MFLLVSVILSTGGGLPQCMLGYCHPPEWEPPQKENPPEGDPPEGGTLPWEGDPPQAHTQGGNWGGSDPGPHPRGGIEGGSDPGPHPMGEIEGIRSRPTPKGEIKGNQIQAHTQGGNWGGSDPGPPPREADSGIRSMSGPYASYWNAFFLKWMFPIKLFVIQNGGRVSISSYCDDKGPTLFTMEIYHFHWSRNCACHKLVNSFISLPWILNRDLIKHITKLQSHACCIFLKLRQPVHTQMELCIK